MDVLKHEKNDKVSLWSEIYGISETQFFKKKKSLLQL